MKLNNLNIQDIKQHGFYKEYKLIDILQHDDVQLSSYSLADLLNYIEDRIAEAEDDSDIDIAYQQGYDDGKGEIQYHSDNDYDEGETAGREDVKDELVAKLTDGIAKGLTGKELLHYFEKE